MGLTKHQRLSVHDLLTEWVDDAKKRTPPRAVELGDDPIALSWASYHVWTKFPARRWVDLKDVEAHAHDHIQAHATRRYYRDRYTMEALKGRNMTAFQTTLYGMVSGEQPIMDDQMGMLMKIPYFYVEDVMLDEIFGITRSVPVERGQDLITTWDDAITPLRYVFASRKQHETHQYWFTDSRGHAVMWPVLTTNPLHSVVRSLYLRQTAIRIRAHWHRDRSRGPNRDHVYYRLNHVELQ